MTNIVLITKNRERLLRQCLKSLYKNTPHDQFNLMIVDDGSRFPEGELSPIEELACEGHTNWTALINFHSIGIVGFLRNIGAAASERYFGRGEYLCFIDNDIAFRPNWLQKMIFAAKSWTPCPFVLGGYQHPFHGTNKEYTQVHETDAVAGYMHFTEWATWDGYGPYDQHAKGVCQSEDFAFCQKIAKDGGKVGYIHPPVILNCGITNSEGNPAVGSENFLRLDGYIYE